MKKCPYCATMIPKEAIKCQHCGEQLNKLKYWLQNLASIFALLVSVGTLIYTSNQVHIAMEQLNESKLNSRIVNRPYVEIQPTKFIVTNEQDANDLTSYLCDIVFELENYGNIPATSITITNFKIGSPSRGYIYPTDISMRVKKFCLFPQSRANFIIDVVMNPSIHVRKYDEGIENLEIYIKISYEGINNVGVKRVHHYSGDWVYKNKQFYLIDSETDLIN